MSDNRTKVEKYIYTVMNEIDPSGNNADRYKKLFESMNGTKFDQFMHNLKEGKIQLHVIIPNNSPNITANTAVDLAKKRNVPLFSKIQFNDLATGRKYFSKYPALIIPLPVRRLSQYLFHKISLPDSDSKINPITGQVIAPDKGATLSNIEIQILAGKGLKSSIIELIKLRGGDLNGYKALKYAIESDSSVSMNDIPLDNKPRSVITTNRYLHGMMIDSNI